MHMLEERHYRFLRKKSEDKGVSQVLRETMEMKES